MQAVKWVRSKINYGYGSEEMLDYLMIQGHSQDEAIKAIRFVKDGKKLHSKIQTDRPKGLIIAIIACFIIIIVVGVFAADTETIKDEQTQEIQQEDTSTNNLQTENKENIANNTSIKKELEEKINKTNSSQNKNETYNSTLKLPTPNKLQTKIILENDMLALNETLQGGYYDMTYTGVRFQGVVIYSHARDGLEPQHFHTIKGWFDNISFVEGRDNYMDVNINSFQQTKEEYKQGTFTQAGTYIYTMTVFDCRSIENLVKEDKCGASDAKDLPLEELFAKLTPISQDTAAIIVI